MKITRPRQKPNNQKIRRVDRFMKMRKILRILEVPLYLMVIALGTLEAGSTLMGMVLMIVSVARLWVNVITDQHTYRR